MLNTVAMTFHPGQFNSPATRNAKYNTLLSNNILILEYLYYILFYDTFTINTFASPRSALNSTQIYSFLQYTPIILTNYPVTTHLSHFTQYNPITQQSVVTT